VCVCVFQALISQLLKLCALLRWSCLHTFYKGIWYNP